MQTSAERGSGEASTRRPSDRELIARFLASRDESAFAEIVTRYSRLVMSVALHTLRDPHAAEDAFQAAFLVLAKSARRIRNRDSLASWLHGTTFRVSHRLLRTRLRRKEQDLPNVEQTAPIWADPERPDEQAALDEELARLSEGLRGPLVLHYLEGRTVPEIAAELKMTQSAIEGRLKRGKKTLRKRLLKRGVLLSSAVFGAGSTVPVEAGVAGALVTATVAACLRTTASATLTPIATSTIQQIALQEMAAMTRIALLKTALVCGGVGGAIGLAGSGANGTLGTAWARQSRVPVVFDDAASSVDRAELPVEPTGLIQTALAQVAGEVPNVVTHSDDSAPRLNLLSRDSGPSSTIVGLSGSTDGQSIRDRANAALQKKIQVSAAGVPLKKLLSEWSQELDVPIHVQEGAISPFFRDVHLVASGMKFDDVLATVLQNTGLEHRVEETGIFIRRDASTERSQLQAMLEHQQTSFRFDGAPLRDVFELIERRIKSKVHLDPDAAKRLSLDHTMTATVSEQLIGKAIDELLAGLPGGPYSVRAEADGIHITSKIADGSSAGADKVALPGNEQAIREKIAKKNEAMQQLELHALQAQVDKVREDAARLNTRGDSPRSTGLGAGATAGQADAVSDLTTAVSGLPAVPEFPTSDAMKMADRQAAAKDQRIASLEEQIRMLQVQVEQMREAANRDKRPGFVSSVPNPQVAQPVDENVPDEFRARPDMTGAGMGIMASPPRAKSPSPRLKPLEDLLKMTDKQTAKEVRDYLAQQEARAGGISVKPEPKVVQTFQSQTTSEERIRKALDTTVDLQFTGQSLQEILNFLAQENKIMFRLDFKSLSSAGVSPDVEINLAVTDLSLRSALELMFEDVQGTPLDYYIEDEVVKVTTKEVADGKTQSVIYDASSLGTLDAQQLMDVIQQTVEPSTWNLMGGKGTVVPIGNSVIVTTTRRLHDKITEIMQMLETHAKSTRANP